MIRSLFCVGVCFTSSLCYCCSDSVLRWPVSLKPGKRIGTRQFEAAKKEGQIVLYGSADFETRYAEFHKKYPEIRVTGVFGRGADVAKRLMSERRAEKYLADLYVNGQTTGYNVFYKAKALDPIPPLLVLPEVADVSKWWQGKHHYVDP